MVEWCFFIDAFSSSYFPVVWASFFSKLDFVLKIGKDARLLEKQHVVCKFNPTKKKLSACKHVVKYWWKSKRNSICCRHLRSRQDNDEDSTSKPVLSSEKRGKNRAIRHIVGVAVEVDWLVDTDNARLYSQSNKIHSDKSMLTKAHLTGWFLLLVSWFHPLEFLQSVEYKQPKQLFTVTMKIWMKLNMN